MQKKFKKGRGRATTGLGESRLLKDNDRGKG